MRCARCRHSWFQAGPELATGDDHAPTAIPAAEPAPSPAPVSPLVERRPRPAAPDRAEPAVPEQPREAEPAAPFQAPPAPAAETPDVPEIPEVPVPPASRRRGLTPPAEEAPSTFEHGPPFRARRNTVRLWTAAAVAFALAVAALIAAANWFGLPDWVPGNRSGFAGGSPDLQLAFPPERQDRRTLPNGTEYFGVSGTITNVGRDIEKIPALLVVMRDGKDAVVRTEEVPPPQPTIAPGETVTVNTAVTDVPRSARYADIGWKPD